MSKYSSGSYVGVEQISYSTLGHTFGQVEPLVIGRTILKTAVLTNISVDEHLDNL